MLREIRFNLKTSISALTDRSSSEWYTAMKAKRLQQLEEFILQHQAVTLEDICREYSISVTTARRDLNELIASGGRVEKVYGGARALAAESPAAPPELIYPLKGYSKRTGAFSHEKEAICRMAAASVSPGDIIFIDTGTTCTNILSYIGSTPCTVITNSLPVANAAAPLEQVTLILLPGRLSRNAMAFVGTETSEALKKYNIDKAFVTTSGVTVEDGLTDTTAEEYTIKCSAISRSREIILLADSTKFGSKSLYTFCRLDQLSAIYTAGATQDNAVISYCKDHQIDYHTAPL